MHVIRDLLAALLLLACAGCSDKNASEPIVVHVFRDSNAAELNSALLAIGAKQLRTNSGRPIVIATMEGKSYAETLDLLGFQYRVELIFLHSPEDAGKLKTKVSVPIALPGRLDTYYAVVSAPASAEQREAAQAVVASLRSRLSSI